MGHGGARENSGPKGKYTDDEGNSIKTKAMRVPEILSKEDIEKLAREKLKNASKEAKSKCD